VTIGRSVVMIDSGGANLASVGYAFERLGVEVTITHDATQILAAERVLLPGVGNAASIMARLNEYELVPVIRSLTCPVLGICLGMQLLFDWSAEGGTVGLGIIPGKVESLSAARELPVPHMGWNSIRVRHVDPLLQGLGEDDWFYFVHGYVAPLSLRHTLGSTIYGQEFPSVVRQSNFWGVQFHPERSGKSGARLLANFLKLSPCV
jgi:imidazole glycerol-phosphate synthase subunit HisH